MSKLGICKQAAITTSGYIPNSVIAYGLYIPKKSSEHWHPHWQRPAVYPVFTHFWVETEAGIIDTGAEQFGEPEQVETSKDDPHYIRVGFYDKLAGNPVPTVEHPKILWDTLVGGDGGLVNVVWDDVEQYLKKLESV